MPPGWETLQRLAAQRSIRNSPRREANSVRNESALQPFRWEANELLADAAATAATRSGTSRG
jgi:hypothetical protein